MKKIKVFLVEDDLDFIFLIQKTIIGDYRLDFCGYSRSSSEAVEQADKHSPDIVLVDINLGSDDKSGIDTAREIRLSTDAKIIFLTSSEQPQQVINASKKAFASGYIYKSKCQNLCNIIYNTALSDTPEELFIRELILQELSIAERSVLDIILGKNTGLQSSSKTIANQKTNIYRKLGIKNASELVHIFK